MSWYYTNGIFYTIVKSKLKCSSRLVIKMQKVSKQSGRRFNEIVNHEGTRRSASAVARMALDYLTQTSHVLAVTRTRGAKRFPVIDSRFNFRQRVKIRVSFAYQSRQFCRRAEMPRTSNDWPNFAASP